MTTTLYNLADMIIRRYSEYLPGDDLSLQHDDVYPYIVQVANEMLKTEITKIRDPRGEGGVQEACIATFSQLAVEPYGEGEKIIGSQQVTADGPSSDNSLVVTRIGEELYHVQVSGIVGHSSDAALETFINDAPEQSIFRIIGDDWYTVPSRFFRGAMSTITVSGGVIDFDYDVLAVNDADPDLRRLARQDAIKLRGLPNITDSNFLKSEAFEIASLRYGQTAGTTMAVVKLPVQPITLPMGQGVWRVFSDTPDNLYIPVPHHISYQSQQVDHSGLANLLSGKNTYYWTGNMLYFNQAISLMPEKITVQLAVISLDKVGEHDPLPVPADYEGQIVEECFGRIVKYRQPDLQTDATPNP